MHERTSCSFTTNDRLQGPFVNNAIKASLSFWQKYNDEAVPLGWYQG